jgi:flagellar secretion chaperone FliS
MPTNPYEQARWDAVLGADPVELVIMLYRGAIDSVRTARRHLVAGDIHARTREITRAMEIVVELNGSLDRSRQFALSDRLRALYAFILESLREGNARQADQPLADAQKVLEVLAAAWVESRSACQEAPEPELLVSRCA